MSLKEWVKEALQKNAAVEFLASAFLSREDKHYSAREQCMWSYLSCQ